MLKHVVYHQSMENAIRKRSDIASYRSETMMIPQVLVAGMISQKIQDSIVEPPFGLGIYINDRFVPERRLTSYDSFARLGPHNEIMKVEVKPGDVRKGLLLVEKFGKLYGEQATHSYTINAINLEIKYGKAWQLRMTKVAATKLVALHALNLYLQAFAFESYIPPVFPMSLKSLIPQADEDAWRKYILDSNIQIDPTTEEFEFELRRFLCDGINAALKPALEFIEGCQAFNNFELHYDADYFYLSKGIDLRYVPYYEQKFPD